MKKLLMLLMLLPLIFVAAVVLASSDIVTNKEDLVRFLKNEIKNGSSEISVTYKTEEKIGSDFAREAIKEALADFDYQKNNYSKIEYKSSKVNGELVLTWYIRYRTTKEEEEYINNYIKTEGEKIKARTNSVVEQVKLVNKLVTDKITYSEAGISYATAYGAIVDGKVVCHGYTLLTERLLTYLGIENKIIVGYNKENVKHSWNLVNIDNSWYHIDATYNDESKIANEFLLKSDIFMSSTRTWDYYAYPKSEGDYSRPVLYASLDTKVVSDVTPNNNITEEKNTEENVSSPIPEEKANVQYAPTVTEEVTVTTSPSTPSWGATYLEKALNYGIVPSNIINNNKTNVTREDFVEIVMTIYLKKGQDFQPTKVFSDTNNVQIAKAFELGITSGLSATTFGPSRNITREQAAVMIYRLLSILNKTYLVTNDSIVDINQASSWSVESIKFLNSVGIMNGVSNNTINPQGDLKKDQAFALAVSTYEYIK